MMDPAPDNRRTGDNCVCTWSAWITWITTTLGLAAGAASYHLCEPLHVSQSTVLCLDVLSENEKNGIAHRAAS